MCISYVAVCPEGVASILTALLISGLFFPRYTAVLGAVYIVGRVMYGLGYRNKGQRQQIHGYRATRHFLADIVDLSFLLSLLSPVRVRFSWSPPGCADR
jgi:uncharacterized membrane protein YecN with MAPEG domain